MKGKETFVMFLFGLPPVKYMKVEYLSTATLILVKNWAYTERY